MQQMKHGCSSCEQICHLGVEIEIPGDVIQVLKDLPGFSKHTLLLALVY